MNVLPENVLAVFGDSPESFLACLWLIAMEGDIFERFGKHPVDLTAAQLCEVLRITLH
jgi:hypothetical protein